MAASHTLPQVSNSRKPLISKSGVLTIAGYGVKMRVTNGHLEVEDGIGLERRHFRLPRVGHGLKRLVCISEDGYVTLNALTWLSEVGTSVVMLDRRGKVRFVTGPTSPSDAKLRRAQALALGNGVGLDICRALIEAKLLGEEKVAREQLKDSNTADVIAGLRTNDLPKADNFEQIRLVEAEAAVAYFELWRDIPVMWPKADLRKIPEHWRTVGPRQSPLSGAPRSAVSPVHSILNYCFALCESESRLALSALGLDPGLGFGLHSDNRNRDSAALDLMESIRASVEGWVLNWIVHEPLQRVLFFETPSGQVRLLSQFCAKLSENASTWGTLVAPYAELVQQKLWESTQRSERKFRPSTPLTQSHRRKDAQVVLLPKNEHACLSCGARIPSSKKLCFTCWQKATPANLAAGRKMAQTYESRTRRAESQRKQQALNRAFDPTQLPGWLTREFYISHIAPALSAIPRLLIRKATGVSEPHAARIQRGIICHARHWQILAQLAGVSPPGG